jgi:hypothetical protein
MTDQREIAGRLARKAALTPEAQLKRSTTQQANARARYDWKPSKQPAWLTAESYTHRIQPALASMHASLIARRLKVSYSYANDIRKGRMPHQRHWKTLTETAGVSA